MKLQGYFGGGSPFRTPGFTRSRTPEKGTGRRRSLASFGLLFVLAGCVTTQDAKLAEARRELGLSYLHEGRNEAAIGELLAAQKLNPRNARIAHELGLAFFAKGIYDKAEENLLRAIKLDPALSDARLNLASLYMAQEQYEKAIPYLEEVIADYLYMKPARAYNNLGWCYFKLGKLELAAKNLDRAIQLEPNFCFALYNYSLLAEQNKDTTQTLIYLQRTVESCPDDLSYRLKLGLLLARLDRDDEALENLEKVVAGDPNGALGAEAREYIRNLQQ